MDKKVFLALGSNIHPKKDYILKSLHWLQKVFGKMKISSIYETNPYNGLVQENYFNCVTSFFSQKDAFNVLKTIQEIEIKLGRKGIREKGQSRTIDIDILFFGKEIIKTETLVVPHYDFLNRDFFLQPLLEIEPDFEIAIRIKEQLTSFLGYGRCNICKNCIGTALFGER